MFLIENVLIGLVDLIMPVSMGRKPSAEDWRSEQERNVFQYKVKVEYFMCGIETGSKTYDVQHHTYPVATL